MTKFTARPRPFAFAAIFAALLLLPALASAYTTPGTGVHWSLDSLATYQPGVFTWDGTNERYVASETLTISATDTVLVHEDLHFDVPDADDSVDEDILVQGVVLIGDTAATAPDSVALTGEDQGVGSGDGPGGLRVEEGGLAVLNRVILVGGGDGGNEDAVDVATGELQMEGCRVSDWAHAAVDGYEAQLTVRNTLFHDNHGYIVTANVSTTAEITGCTMVRNNQATPTSARNPVSVGTQGDNVVTVDSCHIVGTPGNNHGGVSVWNISGTSQVVRVTNTLIEDCAFGVVVRGQGAQLTVLNSRLLNNTAGGDPNVGGSGIAAYSGGEVTASFNEISGNYWGVTLPSGDPIVMLGDGASDDPDEAGFNSITANTNPTGTWALYNNTAASVTAELNWWGSDDPAQIGQVIYDSDDDAGVGPVDWEPFWDGGTGPVIVATTPAQPSVTTFDGETLLFTADVFDPDTPADSLAWSWTVAGTPSDVVEDTLLLEVGNDLPETFAVTVTIADPAGDEAIHTWSVTNFGEAPPPTITGSSPAGETVALQPGDSQAFEVEASSAVGSDLLYTWTVDGDTAAHTSAVTLAFPEEAFYDVVCTVTDTAFASAPSSQRAWTVVAGDPDNVGEDDPALPRELALSGHPNPFNDQASLRIALPRAAEVELALYSITGRRVRSLALGRLGAGVHRIALDGAGLASGTYLLRLRAGSEQRAARLTLLR